MSSEISMSDKQYLAKILFTKQKLDQKIVAEKVGVREATISKWVNEFGWKQLRNKLLVDKEEIMANLYEELSELDAFIRNKPQGERFSNSKEADAKLKLTASIRNLETDLAIADIAASGIKFIRFLQTSKEPIEKIKEVADLWDAFLKAAVKKWVA
jgi:transposase-like protein